MSTTNFLSEKGISFFKKDCDDLVSKVQLKLSENTEWEDRYSKYADAINSNLTIIRNSKQTFNQWSPLFLYMNVTEAKKSNGVFSVRYRGQDVATLKVKNDSILISTKEYDVKNQRDFECLMKLNNNTWDSNEARVFRKHFSNNPSRSTKSSKGNDEHRIESLLLSEFSKTSSKGKLLCGIQPVKIANIARFQMPTPLSASNIEKLKYSYENGGGIDILSRISRKNSPKLCIMEVKDENVSKEPPVKAIKQALIYATFVRELLRSKSGSTWWKIFGFTRPIPAHLELYVTCVMPSIKGNIKTFADTIINIDTDSCRLHYIYYHEKDNEFLQSFETSL